jgi:molybdopterin/thiamine biosynthesis adenylyltransferase/proteasome lid subunit RPN8/RPN11
MTRYTFSILEEHRAALQRSILRDGNEYGALLLCGRSRQIDPWSGEFEERLLTRELVEIGESAFVERTPFKMTWSTTPFYNALKRVETEGLGVAVVHSHPEGPLAFSPADDMAERELFQIAADRLENERPHLSVVMDGHGHLVARAYETDLKPKEVDLIRIIGQQWRFSYSQHGVARHDETYDRQVRAFGVQSTEDLGFLRIGIVGCGGTGSAVASLLARIGVRRLALFDPDVVDETSLNRLHFATRFDANLQRAKVDVVGEGIAKLGLQTSVRRYPYHVDDERCRDALRSCDVLFGCTDDHLGRNFLNRLAHFYLIPVVDLGLAIEPRADVGYDAFDGRVTVVQPGYPCQHCRSTINSGTMLAEDLRRHDPILYQQRRRAGYVQDAPDPSPVVVTFTTELASMAVNEVFQRLTAFRGNEGSSAERVRRFDEVKDSDCIPGGIRRPGCKLCGTRKYDGRGDMLLFLDQA